MSVLFYWLTSTLISQLEYYPMIHTVKIYLLQKNCHQVLSWTNNSEYLMKQYPCKGDSFWIIFKPFKPTRETISQKYSNQQGRQLSNIHTINWVIINVLTKQGRQFLTFQKIKGDNFKTFNYTWETLFTNSLFFPFHCL